MTGIPAATQYAESAAEVSLVDAHQTSAMGRKSGAWHRGCWGRHWELEGTARTMQRRARCRVASLQMFSSAARRCLMAALSVAQRMRCAAGQAARMGEVEWGWERRKERESACAVVAMVVGKVSGGGGVSVANCKWTMLQITSPIINSHHNGQNYFS